MSKTPLTLLLTNINFRNLALAQISSQVALNMLIFVLAISVYEKTKSNAAVSLMFLSYGLPSIIVGVLAGGIVDQFDKKKVMMFCNLTRVVLFIGFFLFAKSLLLIFILTFVFSVVTQFFIPAEAPSIPRLVKDTELLPANSLFTISFYLATVSGFILAGPALKIFSSAAYLLMALLMSFAAYCVFRLPKINPHRNKTREVLNLTFVASTVAEGLLFIKSKIRIEQSLLLLTFSQVILSTVAVLIPGFSDKVLSIDIADSSYLIMGPAAAGLILGAFWVGEWGRHFLKGTIILAGILTAGIMIMALSLVVKNLVIAMFLVFVLGVANAFISVPANTILQQDAKKDMQGRVYGVLTSLIGGGSIIPVIFAGVVADIIGVAKTLVLIGLFILIGGIYQYTLRRKK